MFNWFYVWLVLGYTLLWLQHTRKGNIENTNKQASHMGGEQYAH